MDCAKLVSCALVLIFLVSVVDDPPCIGVAVTEGYLSLKSARRNEERERLHLLQESSSWKISYGRGGDNVCPFSV